MENASKALIMAGAVLIAIVIISMGVYLLSSNQESVNVAADASNTLAIKTYNGTFDKYTTGTIKGSTLKQLFIDAKTLNNQKSSDAEKISIDFDESNIEPYSDYKVQISNYKNGYVSSIHVEKVTN